MFMQGRFMKLDYKKRTAIGNLAEKTIERFLLQLDIKVINIGSIFNNFLHSDDSNVIRDDIRSDHLKDDIGFVMLRYMPDLFVISPKNKKFCIYIDVKAMFTPVFLKKFQNELENTYKKEFPVFSIANIEREALRSYQAYEKAGAKVAILAVCSFNPNTILCDYINNIDLLYTDTEQRNNNSAGSTTPRTNIDLRSMRTFENFLKEEFSLNNISRYQDLLDFIKGKINFIGCPASLLENDYTKNRVNAVHRRLQDENSRQLFLYEI